MIIDRITNPCLNLSLFNLAGMAMNHKERLDSQPARQGIDTSLFFSDPEIAKLSGPATEANSFTIIVQGLRKPGRHSSKKHDLIPLNIQFGLTKHTARHFCICLCWEWRASLSGHFFSYFFWRVLLCNLKQSKGYNWQNPDIWKMKTLPAEDVTSVKEAISCVSNKTECRLSDQSLFCPRDTSQMILRWLNRMSVKQKRGSLFAAMKQISRVHRFILWQQL